MLAVTTTVLLLATHNPGKLAEMRTLLAGLPLEVQGLGDLGIGEAPDEVGQTFIDNAILKARYYSARAGLPAVADDSGLSVAAMGGSPGLHSSRFAGPDASDQQRNALLLTMLADVPAEERGARFTSAVALADGERMLFETVQHVEGFIASEPRGGNGFGYDPLFYYPPFCATFGEVERQRKDAVSHRGQAFARLRGYLEENPDLGRGDGALSGR